MTPHPSVIGDGRLWLDRPSHLSQFDFVIFLERSIMHYSCHALDTNQRFELEIAIADWHAASEAKACCLRSVTRLLGCSEEDAIEICDRHESAQDVLDRLRIEVYSAVEADSLDDELVADRQPRSEAVRQVDADLARIRRRVRRLSDVAYSLLEVGCVISVIGMGIVFLIVFGGEWLRF